MHEDSRLARRMSQMTLKQRRGATGSIGVFGLLMASLTVGIEMDSSRLYVSRHKTQVIADAITMAAAWKLPYTDQCQETANQLLAQYQSVYNTDVEVTLTFYPSGSN